MVKSIIKEVGIIILMLIAVILVFAILLYDYSPTHKTIPRKVEEYKIEASLQNELTKTLNTTENIIKTYTIEEEDLKIYEKTNEYDGGKINPFRVSTEITPTNQTNGIMNETTKLFLYDNIYYLNIYKRINRKGGKKMKDQKGITLVALIITIIVMLILVTVSVTVALQTNLFSAAQGGAKNTDTQAQAENKLSEGMINVQGKNEPVNISTIDINTVW